MQHADHVALLRPGVANPGGVWAEFGAGTGAFTLALAELLGQGPPATPSATLYAVDRDAAALREGARLVAARYPGLTLVPVMADFTRPLPSPTGPRFRTGVPPLDGLVMANALHFVADRHKEAVVRLLKGYLKPGGVFVLVEYNVDQGNLWVPHPLTFATWQALAARAGFAQTRLLGTRPSSFLREFFSAASA